MADPLATQAAPIEGSTKLFKSSDDLSERERKARRRAKRLARTAAEREADKLMTRQHGALARRQAVELKVTKARIADRLETGVWLHSEARGVFVSAASTATPERALMVACLAGGGDAIASHLSAAALLRFACHPKLPQVTVPRRRSSRFQGADVHRSVVPQADRTVVGLIIPCTRPARTLVDCAATVTQQALEDLVDSAFCRYKGLSAQTVLEALNRANPDGGRKGALALRRAVAPWAKGGRAGSPPEMRVFGRIEEWGFPLPERQVVIRDTRGRFVARADIGYPRLRLILEYEGDNTHAPRKWAADDARAKRVRELGWRIEQVYSEDLWPWSTRLRNLLAELFAASTAAA